MKKYILTILCIGLLSIEGNSQNINLYTLDSESTHVFNASFGYDYGAIATIAGFQKLNATIPILLGIEASIPMGASLIDDFQLKAGGIFTLINSNDFRFSAVVKADFKRFESSFSRMIGFGSDFGAIMGWYKPKWHIACELGFEKSIITHIKHKSDYLQIYPNVTDGWYIPSGGQYYLGIQYSRKISKSINLGIDLGKTKAQADDEDAVLPVYTTLTLTKYF